MGARGAQMPWTVVDESDKNVMNEGRYEGHGAFESYERRECHERYEFYERHKLARMSEMLWRKCPINVDAPKEWMLYECQCVSSESCTNGWYVNITNSPGNVICYANVMKVAMNSAYERPYEYHECPCSFYDCPYGHHERPYARPYD